MPLIEGLAERVGEAVRRFWVTRDSQSRHQGRDGQKDTGARSAVTGGAQMDGFVNLVRDLLIENGVPSPGVYSKSHLELPGYFRPQKEWDLLVVIDGQVLATIEFKSQAGPSFGNNYNNRAEEALGNAVDFQAAYREGAFQPSARPWLGYLLLLERCPASLSPVRPKEPHFAVFPEFREASYAGRYEILLTKLVRERLYDATCFLMSTVAQGREGQFVEPSQELSFEKFATSLLARAIAFVKATS